MGLCPVLAVLSTAGASGGKRRGLWTFGEAVAFCGKDIRYTELPSRMQGLQKLTPSARGKPKQVGVNSNVQIQDTQLKYLPLHSTNKLQDMESQGTFEFKKQRDLSNKNPLALLYMNVQKI